MTQNETATPPQRVAVLGGGMAALTALMKLTSIDGWQSRFEFDVYQMGWRLGGKGASGRLRGGYPGEPDSERIVEHGLHLMFGFYENTFRVVREAFDEAEREHGWPGSFHSLFTGRRQLVMVEQVDGEWRPWPEDLPEKAGEPGLGAPAAAEAQTQPGWYVRQTARNASRHVRVVVDAAATGQVSPQQSDELSTLADALDAAADASPLPEADIDSRLRQISEIAGTLLETSSSFTDDLRRALLKAQMMAVIGIGLLAEFGIAPPNWFSLDHYEYRDWLARYGASAKLLESPLVTGLYAGVYSLGGSYAAGTCLHALLDSLLKAKGHSIYQMNAGMGDTIFAPLYRVLEGRGVRFHFFHRVERLHLEPERDRIGSIDVDIQARATNGAYEPLIEEKESGLWTWPAQPLYEQLDNPTEARKHNFENWWDTHAVDRRELVRGRDFDQVLLGISVGAFREICSELIQDERNPRFADMVHGIRTTLTQSAQLWFNKTLAELGNPHDRSVTIPFAPPLDTWADMTHLEAREHWGDTRCIVYVTSNMADPPNEPPPPRGDTSYPDRLRRRILDSLRDWLASEGHAQWRNLAEASGKVHWDYFVAPSHPPETLEDQWAIAAENPSDRYNQAVVGSNAKRLRPEESGYANLVLCGDWTLNPLSVGCLESATMSGIMAAQVLDPSVDPPVNDWLPAGNDDEKFAGTPLILRDGALLAPPPISLDVTSFIFELPADPQTLQAMCDRELNLQGDHYRVVSTKRTSVMLYASRLINRVPGGEVPEIDFGFWVPLVRRGPGDDERLVVYTPYLWVDSSPALVNGTTVFGFPKQMGEMHMPLRPSEPMQFDLSCWLQAAPGHPVSLDRMLTLSARDSTPSPQPETELSRAADVVAAAWDNDEGWANARNLFLTNGMRQVFLKQFMAADGSLSASYQQILETEMPVHRLRELRTLSGDWRLTLRHCSSHDIVSTLGLQPRGAYKRDPFPSLEVAVRRGLFASFVASVEPAEAVLATTRPMS